jgi:hypothetical protein
MRAIHLSVALVVAVMAAGCGISPSSPSPRSPAPSPGDSSNAPEPNTPSPSPEFTASPQPTESPTSSATVLSADERFLLAGIRKDAKVNCLPRRADLPLRATAGVECSLRTAGIERAGFYLFPSSKSLLATYLERMAAEGVKLNTGTCYEGESESNYIPGDNDAEIIPERHGCFVNQYGVANYRATIPGGPVYVGLLGTSGNIRALQDFAWKGSQDTPGAPTIWRNVTGG